MSQFNKKLFKNISPNDFWEIKSVDDNWVSFKNGQNTDLSEFMKMILKNKISIIDNKLMYNFVIGSDCSIYSISQYNSWVEQLEKNNKNEINKNDLKVGYIYQYENLNTFFIYLGKKFYASWKFNKKTKKIELSKVQSNHLAYEVFKHDNFENTSYYSNYCFTIKNKVVKEIGKYQGSLNLDKVLENIKYSRNYVYFEDTKPKEELKLKMKKVSKNDLEQINKRSRVEFLDLFLASNGYYISKHYAIYYSALNSSDDSYFTQISKSDFDEVIFFENIYDEFELYNETEKYYAYDCKLARLTTKCSNDYFRVAPNDCYMLVV